MNLHGASGWCREAPKAMDEAVSMIERAIRLIPGSAMLNYALGQLSREQGSFKDSDHRLSSGPYFRVRFS